MLGLVLSGMAAAADNVPKPDLGLIKPQKLQQHLKRWTLLDARPKSQWQQGHIPRARCFSWQEYTTSDSQKVKYRTLPASQIAATLASWGIRPQTPVVIYGDADTSWGGEGWAAWVLTWLGHQGPIRLLDGGIEAWRQQTGQLSTAASVKAQAPAATYPVNLRSTYTLSTSQLAANPEAYQLVDVRHYLKEYLLGHLPQAQHIHWHDFHQGTLRQPLSPEDLAELLHNNGIDPQGKPIVYYCTGGIRSGYTWLVHMLAGLPPAINYEGGTAAWNQLRN